MKLSDEDSSINDDFTENNAGEEEISTKRKKPQNTPQRMKKIKYEDITSKPKKHKNDLYKPPTVEELNELKETQNLYNNNLFRLQIEELLKEVKIKNKYRNVFTTWFQSFQALIEKLPEYTTLLSNAKKKNEKNWKEQDQFIHSIAYGSIKCDQDFVLKFVKPESVEIFGLDKIGSLPGPKLIVNINLKMSRDCFNVKDYLNNRYFVKRYYYLAYISHFLKKNKLEGEVQWDSYNNNKVLPIIQIKLSEKITVKLFVTPTDNYFKFNRFLPDMNNVKINVFGVETITQEATIFYNCCLAHDVTLSANNLFIEQNLKEFTNIQEAINLICIWLTQRALNSGLGSFTEELVVYFIVYLVHKKRINKHMSSYQVIRNFWNFIDENDLIKNSLSLADEAKPEVIELFRNSFELVFLDRTGYYNVASFINVDIYKKVKDECGIAFKLLDDSGINAFHNLFITKLPVELQYDLFLNLKGKVFTTFSKKMNESERTKYLGLPELYVVQHITEVLKKGFCNRTSSVVPVIQENKIAFGINLDPVHAFNILEKGPALNDPQEKEFKEFWGELATDRRFKDGSVCVAVYFETNTVKGRREIIKTIVDWIVSKKLNLDYRLFYDEFEELLVNKKVTASYPMGTNEECCLKAIAASDELAKKVRALEMPLAVTGVQGIADTFNLTEVFPPISTNYRCGNKVTTVMDKNLIINDKRVAVVPRYVKPVECVLQLEHSSKWPKDLTAIKHMKTAFLFEMSKHLSKKHKIVSNVKPEQIDVLYNGYVFRYHLHLPREIGYLKKEISNNGVVTYRDTPESRHLQMRLDILPKLTGALKGLQSQHPSFGPSTALIKRWLRSHLLDNYHFPDDVINLLNASQYLNQSSFKTACTPQGGFLRFLKFFSEFQWHIQPVIVDFNDEIIKEIADIDSKLLQNREAYPNLFIATPYDDCQSLFTKTAPTKEVLRRVKQLAIETLTCFGKTIRQELHLDQVKKLFVPNLEGYDLIIHLRPLLNPLRHQQVVSDELGLVVLKAYNIEESRHIPVTDFNPVQLYLKELRKNYGEYANFFHDSYGGNLIGVLWKPKTSDAKEFKVSHVNGRKLIDGKLVLNLDEFIEDFYILGKGLVKSIDKR